MRICFVIFAVLLSIPFLIGTSCTKPVATPPEPSVTISITPKSGKAGTEFAISCNNLKGNSGIKIKVLQADGMPVIDRAVTSNNLSTFATSISTFGFHPGHYQCRLVDGAGKQITFGEFDITGIKHIIFEDDYSNGYSGWWVSCTAERTFSYEIIENQPLYQMESKNTSWQVLVTWLERLGQIGDCVIEVDCWSQPGDMAQRGIIFHAPVNNGNTWSTVSFDAFGVSSVGSYALLRITNGTQSILLPYTSAEVIKNKGLPNHLKVAMKGSNIEAYINGLQVATFNDPSPIAKGYVGLAIRDARPDSPVFFDNFLVYDFK
jgi:hypothetical protein